MPSRFVSSSTSPGRAPPLRNSRSGCAAPMTASPYFGSGSRIVWPPARTPPASRTFAAAASNTAASAVLREVLRERRDRQREQHPSAHREHVGQRVGGGDLPVRDGVVHERREEVERAQDREVVRDAPGGGVVRWFEAGDERVGVAARTRAGTRAEPRQRLGQQVRPELRGAAAAVGHLGQADRPEVGTRGHGRIIGRAPGGPRPRRAPVPCPPDAPARCARPLRPPAAPARCAAGRLNCAVPARLVRRAARPMPRPVPRRPIEPLSGSNDALTAPLSRRAVRPVPRPGPAARSRPSVPPPVPRHSGTHPPARDPERPP